MHTKTSNEIISDLCYDEDNRLYQMCSRYISDECTIVKAEAVLQGYINKFKSAFTQSVDNFIVGYKNRDTINNWLKLVEIALGTDEEFEKIRDSLRKISDSQQYKFLEYTNDYLNNTEHEVFSRLRKKITLLGLQHQTQGIVSELQHILKEEYVDVVCTKYITKDHNSEHICSIF